MQRIDQIIEELDTITDDCCRDQDILGIFSAVYRRTTQAVLDAIHAGRFEDASRMEQLDVAFALRYIEAYHAYRKQEPASRSWVTAFDAARSRHLTLMQHLLLGMNAHIMLDLGVAAAQVCPGDSIYTLEKDFVTINDVLKNLIDEIQRGIGRHSPVWWVLDVAGWRLDERLVLSGIRRARQKAWEDALQLAFLQDETYHTYVQLMDARVSRSAERIINLVLPARPLQWLIRRTERNPLRAIPVLQAKRG